MAMRNGNTVTNLMLQRVVAAKVSSPTKRKTGLLQLVVHPVLRIRTVVLMYVW